MPSECKRNCTDQHYAQCAWWWLKPFQALMSLSQEHIQVYVTVMELSGLQASNHDSFMERSDLTQEKTTLLRLRVHGERQQRVPTWTKPKSTEGGSLGGFPLWTPPQSASKVLSHNRHEMGSADDCKVWEVLQIPCCFSRGCRGKGHRSPPNRPCLVQKPEKPTNATRGLTSHTLTQPAAKSSSNIGGLGFCCVRNQYSKKTHPNMS